MHGSPQPVVTSSPSSTYTELVPPNRQHVELSTLQQKVQEPQILTIEPLPKPNEPPQQFQGKLMSSLYLPLPSANAVCEGYVFAPVCQAQAQGRGVCPGGAQAQAWGGGVQPRPGGVQGVPGGLSRPGGGGPGLGCTADGMHPTGIILVAI